MTNPRVGSDERFDDSPWSRFSQSKQVIDAVRFLFLPHPTGGGRCSARPAGLNHLTFLGLQIPLCYYVSVWWTERNCSWKFQPFESGEPGRGTRSAIAGKPDFRQLLATAGVITTLLEPRGRFSSCRSSFLMSGRFNDWHGIEVLVFRVICICPKREGVRE